MKSFIGTTAAMTRTFGVIERALRGPRRRAEEVAAKLAQVSTLNDYQCAAAGGTASYPGRGTVHGLVYVALMLNGESGEVANKVGKIMRDTDGVVDEARRNAIAAELGDVLWYVSAVASELDFTLAEIAQHNLVKIASRTARGVIGGDGDSR
jgi:NTP pyrophosphatase (non-canonical NTP hydrolase)